MQPNEPPSSGDDGTEDEGIGGEGEFEEADGNAEVYTDEEDEHDQDVNENKNDEQEEGAKALKGKEGKKWSRNKERLMNSSLTLVPSPRRMVYKTAPLKCPLIIGMDHFIRHPVRMKYGAVFLKIALDH